MSRMFRQLLMMSLSKPTSLLPEGYTQYDYLERGNNSAYINTGLYANTNTEMELDFMVLNMNGASYFQLAGTYKVGGHFYMRFIEGSNTALFNLSQGASTTYYSSYNPTFKELNRRYLWKLNKDACYINGGKCKDFSNVDEFSNDDTYTIHLFQVRGSSAFNNALRVYGFKLRENGVLTADYIPCQRDSDGVCGMYDLVSNTFKTTPTSYQFTCGNDSVLEGYTKYDYLAKTDYRQFIDTGLGYSDKTEVELGFKIITQDFLGNYINLFGRITSEPKRVLYFRFMKASAYNAAIGDDSLSTNGASAGSTYRDPSKKYIYTINKDGFYVNGNRIKALTNVAEFTDNNTLTLFRVEGGTINSALFQIYSLRIRENGELVADYIPVKRNSDGKCGMYDLVSGTFKTDVSGYGEMECGNEDELI